MKSNLWELAKYVLDNIHYYYLPGGDRVFEFNDADDIQFIYEHDPMLKPFVNVGRRQSIVDLYPSDTDEPSFEIRNNVLSRRNSSSQSISSHHNAMSSSMHSAVSDVELLDQVAHSATHHDPVYSYQYLDEKDHTVRIWIRKFFKGKRAKLKFSNFFNNFFLNFLKNLISDEIR